MAIVTVSSSSGFEICILNTSSMFPSTSSSCDVYFNASVPPVFVIFSSFTWLVHFCTFPDILFLPAFGLKGFFSLTFSVMNLDLGSEITLRES